MITRNARGTGLVRFGVFGSLSATSSASARGDMIMIAALEPKKDSHEPLRSSHPRWAPQLTSAGAVTKRREVYPYFHGPNSTTESLSRSNCRLTSRAGRHRLQSRFVPRNTSLADSSSSTTISSVKNPASWCRPCAGQLQHSAQPLTWNRSFKGMGANYNAAH